MADARELTIEDLPQTVVDVLSTLTDAGHDAVLVGGAIRDRLLGVEHADWDAATSAHPEEVAGLLPGSAWANRFGTVTAVGSPSVEVTSFRSEGPYADARRPEHVAFGVPLEADLARRDFTINAIAWRPTDLAARRGVLVDPFDGQGDLERRVLRAVGDPRERFAEDALRLIRGPRLASRYGLSIEPATEAAIIELADSVAGLSGERVRDELLRMLALDERPSRALALLERLGMLSVILPELSALRGVPQSKRVPGDALDHTLLAVDAAPPEDPDLRLATLLHDLGKATTLRDGHFIGHEEVGADLAAVVLDRLRMPRARISRIVGVVRHHMYAYEATWTDAAVRRFIRRLGDTDRDLLFALRRADDRASGIGPGGEAIQAELERRIATELEREPGLLVHRRLAIDGDDLQRELGMAPGPELGALLEHLTELVLEEPARNEPATLLELARAARSVPGRTASSTPPDRPG